MGEEKRMMRLKVMKDRQNLKLNETLSNYLKLRTL
jgi:hypothetical protein